MDNQMDSKLGESISRSEITVPDDTFTHDRLIDLTTVIGMLSVCGRTIHRLVAAGELPPPAKVGRASRWFLSDVDAYMEKLRSGRDQQYAKRAVAP